MANNSIKQAFERMRQHIVVALSQKSDINHTHNTATTGTPGLMSASDKSKLDGVASGANKYVHPSYTAKSSGLYKVTVDSSGHVSATAAASKADITALGIPAQDTTYNVVTTSADGLMSKTDKSNLDTIVNSFNSDDSNTTIDTVKEVLKAFENAPEGTNIANALAGKASSDHAHGNITKDGKLNTASRIVVTDTNTNITVGSINPTDLVVTTDSRLSDARTPVAHNQASNTINAMTGYSKASSAAAISTSDSLNTAIGKLEKALDGKQASGSYVTAVSGKGLSTNDLTNALKSNYDAAYTHSQAAHAPSNAEKNQNAFSNVVVGSTTIAADTTTDTLTLAAGANITITPDATNDKITIAATDTVYTHPSTHDVSMITFSGPTNWDSDNLEDILLEIDSDIGKKIGLTDIVTINKNGLMTISDKNKLDSIEHGADVSVISTFYELQGSTGIAKIAVRRDSALVPYLIPYLNTDNHEVYYNVLPEATISQKGALSAADKTKLDSVTSGAAAVQIITWEAED